MLQWFIDHMIARRILPPPLASLMNCQNQRESNQAIANSTVSCFDHSSCWHGDQLTWWFELKILPKPLPYKDVLRMNKSAIAFALFATIFTVTSSRADDFSALLADLSFGDAPSLTETLTPTDPPQHQQLRQAPIAFLMPAEAELQAPVAVQPPMIDTANEELIDMEAAFRAQESRAGVAAQTVGHLFQHGRRDSCDSEFSCTPHTAPNLPSSSFYQYFRSNKCNSHVWDGYRQPCRSSNSHINGSCDCFKAKNKDCCSPIYDAPVVECSDSSIRPRHRILPIKQESDDCTNCDTGFGS